MEGVDLHVSVGCGSHISSHQPPISGLGVSTTCSHPDPVCDSLRDVTTETTVTNVYSTLSASPTTYDGSTSSGPRDEDGPTTDHHDLGSESRHVVSDHSLDVYIRSVTVPVSSFHTSLPDLGREDDLL